MPKPSGYWGAVRRTFHNGSGREPTSSSAARLMRILERRDMLSLGSRLAVLRELRLRLAADVGHELHVGARRRNADIALHLLVQRRAEVGAVERIDAGS